MANIIAGETIVEELIQHDVNKENIYNKCKTILSDENRYKNIKSKLGVIKNRLGLTGASAKAAEAIRSQLNEA
jgi:lipid-A-disaccharide synthase